MGIVRLVASDAAWVAATTAATFGRVEGESYENPGVRGRDSTGDLPGFLAAVSMGVLQGSESDSRLGNDKLP